MTLNRLILARVAGALALLIIALLWPWWTALAIGLSLMFVFRWYLEVLGAGLVLDLVYTLPGVNWLPAAEVPVFTLGLATALLVVECLKSRLAFY